MQLSYLLEWYNNTHLSYDSSGIFHFLEEFVADIWPPILKKNKEEKEVMKYSRLS